MCNLVGKTYELYFIKDLTKINFKMLLQKLVTNYILEPISSPLSKRALFFFLFTELKFILKKQSKPHMESEIHYKLKTNFPQNNSEIFLIEMLLSLIHVSNKNNGFANFT